MSAGDEVLLETEDVRVRIMTLAAGQATAWHFHSQVRDQMLCLEGAISVECQGPEESVQLCRGERCDVDVKRIHRVVNLGSEAAKYLLLQGVGRYDFNIYDEGPLSGH